MSVQIDAEQVRRMSVTVPNIKDVANDAARASDAEKNMSLWQSLKLYPKAVGWSVFLSLAIIMEVSFQLLQWRPAKKTPC
jgi:SP family general alpha glucoside:H+ symporter-like MFS transporter